MSREMAAMMVLSPERSTCRVDSKGSLLPSLQMYWLFIAARDVVGVAGRRASSAS